MKGKLVVFFGLLTFLIACRKTADALPDLHEFFLGFRQPSNFPDPIYAIERNPVSKEQFELGKKLFYEGRLSRNNTISCGSCHIQSSGFTHHGHDVSHGIDDRLGMRNAMPIMNLAWNKGFFWDGGVGDLDLSAIVAIESEVEMDETVPNILEKLRADAHYPTLFQEAYGSSEITSLQFLKALSAFMLMAVSSNSKYDKVMRQEGERFSPLEEHGHLVFKEKCASCHAEPLFTDGNYRNNGLVPSHVNDLGRYEITLNEGDWYKFKVPSLRNLKYTAPYMHDGRMLNLDGVLDHYANEVMEGPTLDPLLVDAEGARGIALSNEEREALLAFLETLNDEDFVRNTSLAEQ